jgi:hypothetical protein
MGRYNGIQYAGIAIEGDLEAVICSAVAATIPKWREFKQLNLHQ